MLHKIVINNFRAMQVKEIKNLSAKCVIKIIGKWENRIDIKIVCNNERNVFTFLPFGHNSDTKGMFSH